MIEYDIVMPVFNTPEKDLLESVTTVLNQSEQSWSKLTLLNDASTNADTLRMLEYLSRKDKVEVMYIDKNVGEASALNIYHSSTNVPYIAKCDSDDVFHVDKFKMQIEWLEQHPETSVLSTNLWAFKDIDFERKRIFQTVHELNCHPKNTPTGVDWWIANHGSVIYVNQHVKDAGCYTDGKRFAYDVDLWERMYKQGRIFQCLPECLYAWRRYESKF